MSIANLSNQIRLMNRMVKRDLSTDPSLNDWLIQQIAQMLDSAGTQSILDLVYYSNASFGISMFYDQKTAHVFTDQNPNVNSASFNAGVNGGGLFTVLSRDQRENDQIFLFFTKDGFPVFWNISVDTGSNWTDIRGGLIFVASVVLAAVGAPIMTTIGTAVVGPTAAAAYPALAQGIGQVCISTLMNGGDIEKGVTSAVASYVGAGVGGEVVSATGSDIIGKAAGAATRAFINGGDPGTAAAQSFIQNGVSDMGSLLLSGAGDTVDTFDPVSYDPNIDFGTDPTTFDPGATPIDYSALNTGAPTMDETFTDDAGNIYSLDANGNATLTYAVPDAGFGTSYDYTTPTVTNNGTVPVDSSGGSSNGLAVLTQLATAALPLITSYVRAGMPAVQTGTARTTVNANGTVTTRNANGTVTITKPGAGIPNMTAGGSVVTNNGDGTYTTVNPNGTMSTQQYPASAAGGVGINSKMLYIGLAAVAVLALARR